mmetsp:Transcript_9960/g.19561  ORF Transcript_9960/g.19561 Transcript_9960/m.19561 type:complete len:101 (-) Transcript_9960:73-375(-)
MRRSPYSTYLSTTVPHLAQRLSFIFPGLYSIYAAPGLEAPHSTHTTQTGGSVSCLEAAMGSASFPSFCLLAMKIESNHLSPLKFNNHGNTYFNQPDVVTD